MLRVCVLLLSLPLSIQTYNLALKAFCADDPQSPLCKKFDSRVSTTTSIPERSEEKEGFIEDLWAEPAFHSANSWGFDLSRLSQDERVLLEAAKAHNISHQQAWLLKVFQHSGHHDFQTTTPQPLVPDPNHQGFLKDVGDVSVGFGVGVGEFASVSGGVGVDLSGSGPAGALPPAAAAIFPPQGELWTLDDYTGNKDNIAPNRWRRYWMAVSEGRARPPPVYEPRRTLVGVSGNVGVG